MTLDDQLKRAFDTLTDRLRDELDRQVQVAMDEVSASARSHADETAAAAVAAVPPPPAPEPPPPVEAPPPDTHAVDRSLDAVRALDGARSLTDILETLIASTAHDGVGAGVWLMRAGSMKYWRSKGIAPPPGDQTLDDPHAIAEAARTNTISLREGVAVPLALSGHVVAVLFASSAEAHASPNAAEIELVTRHAARCLESMTAFRTARAMAAGAGGATAGPAVPATARPAAAVAAATAPANADTQADAQADTQAEEHVSAQRYARLLISEIKLYHEQAVVEGRRDRDLGTRLGGEIARARVMYEQRVPAQVRQQADHFHDELVRTLADGDASLLEMRA